jgi:hypothetical protein
MSPSTPMAGRPRRRDRGGHGLRRGAAGAGLMMRLLKTVSFTPYVIYRVILGVILLWLWATAARLRSLEVRRAFLDLGVLARGPVRPQVVLQHRSIAVGVDAEIGKGLAPRPTPRCRGARFAPGPASTGRCENRPSVTACMSNTAAMIPAIQNGTFTIKRLRRMTCNMSASARGTCAPPARPARRRPDAASPVTPITAARATSST